MKKRFLVLLTALVFVSSCGGSVDTPSLQTVTPVLVAQGEWTKVYRFQDGNTTCYFTEGGTIEAGDIFCK